MQRSWGSSVLMPEQGSSPAQLLELAVGLIQVLARRAVQDANHA